MSVLLSLRERIVGWVEFRETHHELQKLVGLVRLDPPYICPKSGRLQVRNAIDSPILQIYNDGSRLGSLPAGHLLNVSIFGGHVVKLTLRDKESAQEAVRRFRKLVERSGIKKEMRVREFYEKPSEIKRRARLRAERRTRRERFLATH